MKAHEHEHVSKRKSSSNDEHLSRKLHSVSNSGNSAGKKRSSPINISLESDDEIDNADTPSRSTEITNQSSSATSKGFQLFYLLIGCLI